MTPANNGGAAFPTAHPESEISERGMSLRDWFAGKALQGLLAAPDTDYEYGEFAAKSYKLADAMLAERDK